MQELGQRRRQVEDRAVHVELVHVAGDGAGQQLLLQRLLGHVEGEAARAVADVQVDAPRHRRLHLGQHPALVVEDAVRPGRGSSA